MRAYKIRVLLHSNFRPQGGILVSTSQEMRICHSGLGQKNTRIERTHPYADLELFYRGVSLAKIKLYPTVPISCDGKIWIEAYSPCQEERSLLHFSSEEGEDVASCCQHRGIAFITFKGPPCQSSSFSHIFST